jgi:hypothetical protein
VIGKRVVVVVDENRGIVVVEGVVVVIDLGVVVVVPMRRGLAEALGRIHQRADEVVAGPGILEVEDVFHTEIENRLLLLNHTQDDLFVNLSQLELDNVIQIDGSRVGHGPNEKGCHEG